MSRNEIAMEAIIRAEPRERDGARALAAGDLRAIVVPGQGMICTSLLHRGAEILRRVEDLAAAAAAGKTAGIPLLYPWANRLSGTRYRAAGREVVLDPTSPLLHLDDRGLPMHGVPWSRLSWEVTEEGPAHLVAGLDWTRPERLALFPFPHRVELAVTLRPGGLTFETTVEAGTERPVPVAFGFHPYVGLPGIARSDWRLTLPAMRRLVLDPRGIPTEAVEPFPAYDRPLHDAEWDDGFALTGERASFAITGGGRRIAVEVEEGFRYAQVFAPKAKEFVALEPMTAPTDALTSGQGLTIVEPGLSFRAVFHLRVEDVP